MPGHSFSGRGGPFIHGRQPGTSRRGASASLGRGIGASIPIPTDTLIQAGVDNLIIAPHTAIIGVSPPGAWPDNEPPGLSPVYGDPASGIPAGTLVDGSNRLYDYSGSGGDDLGASMTFSPEWDSDIVVATSSGSRYANVIQKNFNSGDIDGWNGTSTVGDWALNYEEVYLRMIFRLSPNYQFNGASDKLWYLGEANSGSSDFWIAINNSEIVDGKVWHFQHQGGGSGDRGGWRSDVDIHDPGGPVGDIRGSWQTVEIHMVAQSVLGVSDGSFTFWHNDVEVTDWRRLGQGGPIATDAIDWYGSGHNTRLFSGVQFPLYWGGGGGQKTVNDYIEISEVYITGKLV